MWGLPQILCQHWEMIKPLIWCFEICSIIMKYPSLEIGWIFFHEGYWHKRIPLNSKTDLRTQDIPFPYRNTVHQSSPLPSTSVWSSVMKGSAFMVTGS